MLRLPRFLILLLLLSGPAMAWQDAAVGDRTSPPPVTIDRIPADQIVAIEDRIVEEMESQSIVGLSAAITRGGRIVWASGFGYADREKALPADLSTMYRWASISKPVTAIAGLQLVEEGKLDLDADVRSIVPSFPDHGQVITPRQLMTHQSGIVHYTNGRVVRTQREYEVPHPYEDVELALDTFRESPLLFAPGEKYSYSTHAYILLSAVVQRAGGQKFADQVRDRIAKPLSMQTFQPDYQWIEIPNRTIGYRKLGERVIRSTDTDVSWKLGGGGYISNVLDLARFAAGVAVPGNLLKNETWKAMTTRSRTNDGAETGIGLGIFVSQRDGKLYLNHSGAQEKTATYMQINATDRITVCLMCNTEGSRLGDLGGDLMKLVESSEVPSPAALPVP